MSARALSRFASTIAVGAVFCGVFTNPASAQSAVTTTFDYNARGNATAIADGKGRVASAGYDSLGRLTSLTLPDGLSQSIEYLPRHLIDRVSVDPVGAGSLLTTRFEYDQRRQRTKVTDPSNDASLYTYDDRGLLASSEDGENRRSVNAYLPDGSLYCVRSAYGTPLQQSSLRLVLSFWGDPSHLYSPRGVDANCESLNDSYRSTASFDAYGRSYKLEFPDLTRQESTLLGNGLPSQEFNRANDLTTITYDSYNRVQERQRDVASPPGSATRVFQDEQLYTYDKEGRLLTATRNFAASASVTLTYAYDTMGRPASETRTEGAVTRTVGYRYDELGNRTAIIWPDNWTARYVYDVNGRLKEVWADPNGVAACASQPHVCGDGVTGDGDEKLLAGYSYDAYGRLSLIRYGGAAGAAASSVEYAYKPDGGVEQMRHGFLGETGVNAEVVFDYTYDKSGKLTGTASSDAGWIWDGVGEPAATYAVASTLDQYPSVTQGGATRVFGHDLNGNLASDTGGALGNRTYTHNALGQMTGASGPAFSAAYKYDPMDRRMSAGGTGVTAKSWVHAGDMEIAEYSGSGALLRRFVPGTAIDQHVAMVEADGSTFFYHSDRLGNIIALSNGTTGSPLRGDLTDKYVYTPFGIQLPLSTSPNPFRYTGRRFDPETGLYHYRARFYDASLGRFLQPDPIGYEDQMNLYAYVGNDPLNATDPMGKEVQFKFTAGTTFKDAVKMFMYLGKSSTAKGEVKQIVDSAELYTIQLERGSGNMVYESESRTIFVDVTSGLKVLPSGEIQSPALGAGHEIGHAATHDRMGDTAAYQATEKRPTKGYAEVDPTTNTVKSGTPPSSIAEDIATAIETRMANELGEPTRQNYEDYDGTVTTCGPTSRTPCSN